jgi:hypothetical protein
MEIDFDPFIPADLALGVSGTIDYQVDACTQLDIDSNPANDCMTAAFSLDYWHDIIIDDITSPSDGAKGDLIWDNGDTDGSNGLSHDITLGRRLLDDFELTQTTAINELQMFNIWFSAPPGSGTDFELEIWDDAGGVPGSMIASATSVSYTETATGRQWFSRDEALVEYVFDPITLSAGTYWIHGTVIGPENSFWMAQSDPNILLNEAWVNYDDLGGLMSSTTQFGQAYGISFQLYGTSGGAPGADIYVAPGPQTISMDLLNDGTFDEFGLDAYGEIYEYITNSTVGTLVWDNEVLGIDVLIGETVGVTFPDTYDFQIAGIYALELAVPLGVDDYPGNNEKTLGIGVDDTAPTSTHALDPPAPTGANGWYVDDVTVTLSGSDGTEPWQSGIDHFEYRIDGGAWQTGSTFDITTNGQHTIDYKAVDAVGNEEAFNSFDIDMDQDGPTIDLTWEAVGGLSQDIIFTAGCSDADSGMDYVEFYFNDVLQHTDDADPYEWIMTYAPGTKFTVKAIAYDLAGNTDFDELTSGEGLSVSVYTVPTPLSK